MATWTISKKLNVSPYAAPLVIQIKQYTSDFALKLQLYSTVGDLDIPAGATTKIRGTKRDGNGYELTGTRIGHTCTFSGTKEQMQQMTAAHGRCVFEVVVEHDGKELITANFYLEVQRAAMDAGTVTSESIIEEFADFQSKITAAQAAATAAQEQADRAEAAAESIDFGLDPAPTQGSNNAVSSGGVKSALDAVTAQIPAIDPTLTQSGQAADAKVVGDAIDALDIRVSALEHEEEGEIVEKTVSGGSVVTVNDGANGINITSLAFNIDASTTGATGAVISHSGADTSDPETLNISWESEAGGVGAGTAEINGETVTVTKTWGTITIAGLRISDIIKSSGYGDGVFYTKFYYVDKKANGVSNAVSDTFATASGTPANLPDMSMVGTASNEYLYFRDDRYTSVTDFFNAHKDDVITYELVTPATYTAQADRQLSTYSGVNKFWANTGKITSLTYSAFIPSEGEEVSIDPTLSIEGDAADAKVVGDAIGAVDAKLEAIRTATSSDVGKVLKAKTVTSGKVVEWEFGDADAFGQSVNLATTGFYWSSAQIGTAIESNLNQSTNAVGKCTMVSLSAGDVLRITSTEVNTDTLARMFFAYDASTGICIDKADKFSMGVYKTYFLKYDVDTHVYINAKATNNYAVNMATATNPLSDIACLAGPTRQTVMELNGEEKISYSLKSMKRKQYTATNTPTVFLHFSDLHGDGENLKRIVDFANEPVVSSQVDDIVCTGDVVFFDLSDGMTFYNDVDGSEDILLTVGNHDATNNFGNGYVPATPLETYNALMAENIATWDVTQPTGASANGLCYYYKDYTANNLRAIFIDATNHGDNSYITAEASWLADVLQSAYSAGLSVVCFEHYPFAGNTYTYVPCSFSPRYSFNIADGAGTIPTVFIDAVETFIGYGGDFVAWIAGHGHQDFVLLHTNTHQMCIGVSCAIHTGYNIQYGDELREAYKKSQDLFNILAIDTTSKNISIMRVGADLTRLMNSKKHLCINYATRTVVWND